MKLTCFPSLIAAVMLTGCQMPSVQAPASAVGDPGQTAKGEILVTEGSNQMGFDLLRRLDTNGTKNIVISPYSILTALWLVTSGARGTTSDELRSALHFKGNADDVSGSLKPVAASLSAQSEEVTLKIANALFVQKSFPLSPQFVSNARTAFDGTVSEIDFADPGAVGVVNGWVDKNTGGKIKTIVDMIAPSTKLILANAVYFKAPWASQFNEALTKLQPFTTPQSKVNVPFMHKEAEMLHGKNSACEILVLPYKEPSTCEMVFLLPAENSSVSALVAALPASFSGWRESVKPELGAAEVPKFKTTYDSLLNAALSEMGVKSAFSAQADFTGITSSKPLAIDEILHKTYLDVNEKGTEAAAVTVVSMGRGIEIGPEPVFNMKIDRPFVLAIVDTKTKTVLFIGAIHDPVAK